MLGFPGKHRYVMIKHREDAPFFWYQSVDEPGLAFVITNPFLFKPDYEVDISELEKTMSWNGEEGDCEVALYVVVNIPNGCPEKMTANLIGPIVINSRKQEAVQMIVSDSPYTHKFPMIKEA